ncbi:MAG: hypothetical protein R2713_11650 [Ilumatobacteraceae bacterium]
MEDETVEEVEKDVFIPFIHRPLSRYVNAGRQRAVARTHARTVATRRVPRPGRGVLLTASTIPRLLYLRTRKVPGA